MTYDRRGRPAPKASDAEAVNERTATPATAGSATPNAARAARGRSAPGRPSATAPTGRAGNGAKAPRRSLMPRLLPLTIMTAALLLSVKVGTVWEHRAQLPSILTMKMAVSVGTPAAAGARSAGSTGTQLAAAEGNAAGKPAAESNDTRIDPFALGKSQIELLQSLSERRKELDARERAIEQREGLLAAAEHRIESKIGELKAVRSEIEGLIKKYDEQEEQQIAGLVKIYETMKPKDAARIFNELDIDVLLEVFERMKASKTAPVLADMDALKAKEITLRIADRKKMPNIN